MISERLLVGSLVSQSPVLIDQKMLKSFRKMALPVGVTSQLLKNNTIIPTSIQ